ncbi:MAG: signal peptidase I [Thermoleophilaceae bacterium]|nr:signal peptidase I [Thermoleophilaceae bacterium]
MALGLALGIQAFLVKPFRIPSESMVPQLAVGQRVLVDRVSGRFSDPGRGDVVVFKPPKGADDGRCGTSNSSTMPCGRPTKERSETNFIKRVVGLPGERLKVVKNQVYINGVRQEEPFINKGTPCAELCNMPEQITIPKDHYFMMGDNRGASADSREWGPVPKKWMIGNAFMTYWPPKRIGRL